MEEEEDKLMRDFPFSEEEAYLIHLMKEAGIKFYVSKETLESLKDDKTEQGPPKQRPPSPP